MTVPLVPVMAESLEFSPEIGALLVTVYALVYTVAAPVFGTLSDHRGRKECIVARLFILGVGTVMAGFGTSFREIMVYRAVTGLGASMLEPAVFAMVADRFSYASRGKAMGVVMAALVASTLVGIPIGTYVAAVLSWRWTLCGVGVIAILLTLGAAVEVANDRPTQVLKLRLGMFINQYKAAFSSTSVSLALLSTFLWFAALQGVHANLGLFYSTYYGLTVHQIGLTLLVAGLGSVVGSVIGGRLADSVGKQAVVMISSVGTAIGVLSITWLTGSLFLTMSIHVFWATSFGLGHAALAAFVSELQPAGRGTVLSLNSSAMYGGMMSSTALAAVLLQVGGGTFNYVGIFCAAGALAVLPIIQRVATPCP